MGSAAHISFCHDEEAGRRRRLGLPGEVAAAIVFVAIGKAEFMTGLSISVDGAVTA